VTVIPQYDLQPTLEWSGGLPGELRMIDQTLLPGETRILHLTRVEEVYDAIRALVVRGAPAIGLAAAYGMVLAVQNEDDEDGRGFALAFAHARDYLASSRPTAVNLFWALNDLDSLRDSLSSHAVSAQKRALLDRAHVLYEQDRLACREMGRLGAELIEEGGGYLTHCNAGGLATADYGTALAVFFAAQEAGKTFEVFADETRPLLQGARLTTWELMRRDIPVTLLCDNAAGWLMGNDKVNGVFVGADRVAANGDAANKIGTYAVAILARAHDIPFYVVAPTSTIDPATPNGEGIPIEERSAEEITEGFGKRTAPEGVKTYSPAFDVTPANLVTALITEKGVVHSPTTEKIRNIL
jgi:methylthioribose-1-phosphate isomerase